MLNKLVQQIQLSLSLGMLPILALSCDQDRNVDQSQVQEAQGEQVIQQDPQQSQENPSVGGATEFQDTRINGIQPVYETQSPQGVAGTQGAQAADGAQVHCAVGLFCTQAIDENRGPNQPSQITRIVADGTLLITEYPRSPGVSTYTEHNINTGVIRTWVGPSNQPR